MNPLVFQPLLKQARWGGRRLALLLNKQIGAENDYAESWEIADHHHSQTIVLHGDYAGWSLQRLVSERAKELLGQHATLKQFPLLIKFLDASDRLSLQVHPDDQQVLTFHRTENGKTEAWIIIHAEPGSRLYAGLKAGITRTKLASAIQAGTIEDCVHSFAATAGDVVFIPAGTAHAIGEGIVLAEIQQSSDVTFRLHDWGRIGTDSKPRNLHIEEGLSCINFTQGPVNPIKPKQLLKGNHQLEELVRCEQFVVHRHRATSSFGLRTEDRFRVLTTLAGNALLQTDDTEIKLITGKTVLVPADCSTVTIQPEPDMTLIESFLP